MYTAPFLYYIPIFNHLFLLSNKTIVLTINRRTKNDTIFIISVGHINVDSLFNIFYGTIHRIARLKWSNDTKYIFINGN